MEEVDPGAATMRGRLLKRRVRERLSECDLEGVASLADTDHRVLGSLIALTYDADRTLAWRAVEALGMGAERIADRDPEAVRKYLRRLFWLITEESGGICWFAPQGMAEIARRRPDRFGEFIPITINLLREMAEEDLDHFRQGTLWAIARFGPLAVDHYADVADRIEAALDHPDPEVRGLAVWAAGNLGWTEPISARAGLLDDDGAFDLYRTGSPERTTVAELARIALSAA